MKRALAVLALLLTAGPAAAQQAPPLAFAHLIGTWRTQITGIGPDGERATRHGSETCRWTAGETAVLCEATYDAFGTALHETSLFVAQAATGAITRTTSNSRGLAVTARCRAPQPTLLLCAAEVPTGDPDRTTHLRDETRLRADRQTIDWEASRDRQKTWTPVGHGEKTRVDE